ncbi:MAG: hypothetical protein HY690_13480 [Chloroflexi bacterium]|nr:hypothetical protein [Chloroflexota bacterium]
MDPLDFCRQVMADYEEQWTEARGHQERHPLRAKMHALEALMDRLRGGEGFERLLQQARASDDPALYLLCEELCARWGQAAQRKR